MKKFNKCKIVTALKLKLIQKIMLGLMAVVLSVSPHDKRIS